MRYLLQKKQRLLFLLFLIPLGFSTKFYSGFAELWVNNSLGGVLYVIFFAILFSIIIPQIRSWKISLFVFSMTSFIEILQLWHPPFLEQIRSNFFGRTLLGNCFVWSDFFYYFIGMILAVFLLHFWDKLEKKSYKNL